MDIKKLIADLQVCADDDIICPACDRYYEMKEKGGTVDCVNKLLRDAAEELTELLDENDNLQQRIFILRELAPKQKWIPVAERLPEELPENEGKKIINCIVAHDAYSNGKLTSQFRQRKWDKYYERWYWSKIGECTITHWMPLPEPPKEGKS